LALLLALAVVIGGRTFYVLQHPAEFAGRAAELPDLSKGGQVFYGGLLLALPVLITYCKLARLPVAQTLDLVVVGAPLGLTLGRWGCFCRGCYFGRPAGLPWAVAFPKHIDIEGQVVGSPAYVTHLNEGLVSVMSDRSLPVHPAQIYASFVSFAVFLLMLWLWRRRRAQGRLLPMYLGVYASTRFLLEFTRQNEMAFWGLTIPQVVSLVVLAALAPILFMLRRFRSPTRALCTPKRRRR
jgi:phosphatidylglycerol:prolipoprotein diacylglycerol transferase